MRKLVFSAVKNSIVYGVYDGSTYVIIPMLADAPILQFERKTTKDLGNSSGKARKELFGKTDVARISKSLATSYFVTACDMISSLAARSV